MDVESVLYNVYFKWLFVIAYVDDMFMSAIFIAVMLSCFAPLYITVVDDEIDFILRC